MRAIWLSVVLLLAACASTSAPAATGSHPAATPSPPVLAVLDLTRLPGAAASGPDGLWIADYDRGEVTHVSGGSRLSESRIRVGDPKSLQPGCQAGSVHYAPTGSFIIRRCDLPAGMADGAGAVWTGRNDEQAVLRLDPRQGRVVATIPVGMHVFNLAAAGSEV